MFMNALDNVFVSLRSFNAEAYNVMILLQMRSCMDLNSA